MTYIWAGLGGEGFGNNEGWRVTLQCHQMYLGNPMLDMLGSKNIELNGRFSAMFDYQRVKTWTTILINSQGPLLKPYPYRIRMVFLAKTPLETDGHRFAVSLLFLEYGANPRLQSREDPATARNSTLSDLWILVVHFSILPSNFGPVACLHSLTNKRPSQQLSWILDKIQTPTVNNHFFSEPPIKLERVFTRIYPLVIEYSCWEWPLTNSMIYDNLSWWPWWFSSYAK